MPQIYDMGPKEVVLWIFFALKNSMASAGFEPANLGTKGQHATPWPPKSLVQNKGIKVKLKKEIYV